MTDGKKILIIAIIAIILFGAGLLSGVQIRKAVDNQRIREYRDTVDSLGIQIDELRELNYRLADSNHELKYRLGELTDSLRLAQGRIDKAREIIEELGSGLSGASGDVRAIIKAVRNVIAKIEQLGGQE